MRLFTYKSQNLDFFIPERKKDFKLLMAEVQCGFPSPAQDYIENKLDLNEYLIKHPSATFFARAKNDSMTGAGIYDGDLIIIDRSLKPAHNRIVLAVLDGEFTIKRIDMSSYQFYKKISLVPENPKYKPMEINEYIDFTVWGIATYVIHPLL
jgi:DNA polymerase V